MRSNDGKVDKLLNYGECNKNASLAAHISVGLNSEVLFLEFVEDNLRRFDRSISNHFYRYLVWNTRNTNS